MWFKALTLNIDT